jgi:hypothetical protein
LLLASICFSPTLSAGDDDTMTMEDVVRLFVQGSSTEELIQRIQSSQVDFDLADEMLDELRLAGLSEKVIEAMMQRQRELHPPATPEVESAPEETQQQSGLTFRVALQGGTQFRKDDSDRGVRVADFVPPETLEQLGVRDPEARITNVAFYVACHSSTHVPDHWRGQTPLGRDFHSVTRHKMLLFHSEATTEDASTVAEGEPPPRDMTMLVLQVPEQLAAELDPSVEHDLSAGVAVQIDGRYYRVVSGETEDFVPALHEGIIDVTIELPENPDPSAIAVRLNP